MDNELHFIYLPSSINDPNVRQDHFLMKTAVEAKIKVIDYILKRVINKTD